MCFLTGMEGDYQGAGENIHIENDDNYWVLNGSSAQNSVTGWATCVDWSDFAGNAVMWGASKQSNTSIGAQCVYYNQQ
jgi:hypothetical protein